MNAVSASGRLFFCLVFLSCLLQGSHVQAYDCSIPPVTFKLQNATFKNDVTVNRGVKIELPGDQIVGLRISFCPNNTRIRSSLDCTGNSTEYVACQGASGSIFNPITPGFEQELDSVWEASVLTLDAPPTGANVVRGIGLAEFDDGPSINLPIEVWSDPKLKLEYNQRAPNKSVLALGPKSSVLQRILDANIVPSKFMGLFFGSRSQFNFTNGELVVGGWDRSRVSEPFVNYSIASFPMNISCPLRVKVKDVVLNNDEGSFPMLNVGESVPACIDPLQNQLTFTDAMYRRWSEATQHPAQQPTDAPPFTNQTCPAANEHLIGNLTIELEGGYKTTIPHYELVSLDRGPQLDEFGQYDTVNSSRIMAAVGTGLTDYGQEFGMLLGGVFLSSTYLTVNYDNGTFGLAPAVLERDNGDIETVCSPNTSIPISSPSTTPSSSPSTTPSSSPSTTPSSSPSTTPSSSPSTTPSSSPSPTPSSSPSPTPSPTPQNTTGGRLSTGEKVGTAIGVVTAFLGFLGLILGLKSSRGQSSNPEQSSSPEQSSGQANRRARANR